MILVLGSSAVHAPQPESLNPTLESYLKEFGLPAIAAAVFNGHFARAQNLGAQKTPKSDNLLVCGHDELCAGGGVAFCTGGVG
jgi:hypothetical protein